MDNVITWKQLIVLLKNFPRDAYEAFPYVCAKLSAKVPSTVKNIDKLRKSIYKIINLHRVAFVLSRLHRLDPTGILESYDHWLTRFKDMQEEIGNTVLPAGYDILACQRHDLEPLLLQAFTLLPNEHQPLLHKFVLISNLRKVGWENTAEAITDSAAEDIKKLASKANDAVEDLKKNTLWSSELTRSKRVEKLIKSAGIQLVSKL